MYNTLCIITYYCSGCEVTVIGSLNEYTYENIKEFVGRYGGR